MKKTIEKPVINNLMQLIKRFPNEETCREFLIQSRWGDKPICPCCGNTEKIYRIQGGKLLKCSKCRKPFSIRVGTIFEDSALPLQKWFHAVFVVSAHKKGISSCQLARDISVTQKTAWHMLHRIRLSMSTNVYAKPLNGIIEVDETFIGGITHGQGAGYSHPNKTAVFGMAERGGDVRVEPVKSINQKTLRPIIGEHVTPESTIVSDEFLVYKCLNERYKEHLVVNHSKKQYVNGMAHTNTIEGFWSLLKRGIIGIYHHVSPEHLHRYCEEFEYRYNSRKLVDSDRFALLLNTCNGRLTYKNLIRK